MKNETEVRKWRRLTEKKATDRKFFLLSDSSSVSAHVQNRIMMWTDVHQLSPLLGAVRHLAGHRWQHYDGLGIVIQDACHLFTSWPSLISQHRPYNLANTSPTPPPHTHLHTLPGTVYKTTPYITTAFFSPLPPNLSLALSHSYISGLNTVNTFNALIYVLCSPISQGLGRCLLLSTPTPENWLGFIQTSRWEREGRLRSNLHFVFWTIEPLKPLKPKFTNNMLSFCKTYFAAVTVNTNLTVL